MFDYGGTEVVDDEKISDSIWKIYYDYLTYLYEQCLKIREDYRFTDKEALEINRYVDPNYRFTETPAEKKKSHSKKKLKQQKFLQ